MCFAWLFPWWKRPPAAVAEGVQVVLYTRPGCHLCEGALAQLEEHQKHWRFQLTAVNVDSDAGLAAQHGDWVPVVTIDGQVRFRGAINDVLLTRLLRAEAARRPR